ncbi:MAG: Txe/YoeB family addiction module toxin [Clostridiales Family XIII bacterium]|jgi:toxin YoeB|nr:Txe/YoeB family addiction module toxin [Clostridiales Family XIII bacterium]
MKVTFTESAWDEYVSWQTEDKKTLRNINRLIQDIQRNGLMSGRGKPELLKYVGTYSRRIDEKNRLQYMKTDNGNVEIISCKGHYQDK